jgi:hypothetical protein
MFTATTLSAIVAGLVALAGLIKLVTYLVKTSRQRTYIKLKAEEAGLIDDLKTAAGQSNALWISTIELSLNRVRAQLALYNPSTIGNKADNK